MRSFVRSISCTTLGTCLVLLTGCGVNFPNPATATASSSSSSSATVSITLTGSASVVLGAQSQYAANVSGSSNSAVTWSVNGTPNGSPVFGSISPSGLYTAPQTAPSSTPVMITATSVADAASSSSLTVALVAPPPVQAPAPPAVSLTLTGPTKVSLGMTSLYSASVTGTADERVSWMVNGVPGGNASSGVITTSGVYTAPVRPPTSGAVTIAATSVANPAVSQDLVATLVAPPPPPPPTPPPPPNPPAPPAPNPPAPPAPNPPAPPASRIPSYAISAGNLDASTNWQWNHDPGTPGSSQGSTVYPVSGLSPDDHARKYYMTYSRNGGEIYYLNFGKDTQATHFVYETYVYTSDASQIQNLEMDMNQVMADDRTVILATQCSSISKRWDYTLTTNGGTHWHPSNIPCNPLTWAPNQWHHIQIASHRDDNGNVTYDWVNVDETYTDFVNATGYSAESLGWAIGSMVINFQIDGENKNGGAITLYTDKRTVYRW
jgi:hypothetical protein